ncbi:MAG: NAD(P)-binding domain-containing protein [Paludibacteraceae bacterium]|nr:NAD(P)-binding domain-containing protein [Paludibacteraceae bacterium]
MDKRVAILGSGSWATALAKIVMLNQVHINWYMRKQLTINEFQATGKNPGYLTNAKFDTSRITFSANINNTIKDSDILILAIPSPYVLQTLKKIRTKLTGKTIISAVKGMIPSENVLITDYLHNKFDVPMDKLAIIAGPCHAEEIALERLSYLTIGCLDLEYAKELGQLFETDFVRTTPSTDVDGLEYSSVMKNIYAIAAGLCHSLRYGDNFQAVLISNAIQEIQRFADALGKEENREINASGYLGDVLVTCYSKFSRNRQFGQMIGMGYSVKAAQMEMEMVAEGYYGTQAIHALNEKVHCSLPIVDAIYDILFNHHSPTIVVKELTQQLQ